MELIRGHKRRRMDNPTTRDPTAALVQRFNEHKLETEFFVGYVVHKTCQWKHLSSDRSWETSTWTNKGIVGIGGFGAVYLEERKERGRRKQLRAVKILPRNSLPEASRSQELLVLVKLSGCDHLFVKFLGWYEDPNHIFLAMEYIEHGDLSEYIRNTGSRKDAKEITRQVLEGLVVLHEKGICHRDLKPQNILMASLDPVWVKIADFGISKRVKNTTARTRTGSPGYTAPEILGVVPQEFIKHGFIPHALDMWSLGSLVHELLTSETPFLMPLCGFGDIELESGLSELELERTTDFTSLLSYCRGNIEFPTDVLQRSQLDEEGIAFVKDLLIANPKYRPTAICALRSPWLTGYTYISDYAKKLKGEFSGLGVDLDLDFGRKEDILMRQVRKEDIMRFLPGEAKAKVPSLILEAIAKGYSLATPRLLESLDYNLGSMDDSTRGKLLQLLAETGQLDVVKILLESRADIGARIGDQTVLQWMVQSGNVKSVNLLLEYPMENTSKFDLFLLATKSGNIDMVEVFLDRGVNINATNSNNQTALQAAARNGHIDIVKLLLDNKADVNSRASGWTALQAAARNGHIDVVKLLLDNKADVNAQAGVYGITALQAAARGGHTDIVRLLLDNKADVNAQTGVGGITALQAAARGGHTDIVRLLLDNKADVNAQTGVDGITALQAAARGGHTDIVRLLLDNKADVNAQAGVDGITALQAAARGGHTDIVKLLLDNKADVDSRVSGWTALQSAARGGHIDTVKLLLDRKADVNAQVRVYGLTALQAAARGGHIDVVKLLLNRKADVNAQAGVDGITALQATARGGHIDVVKLLLDNKADVNAQAGVDSITALQVAAGGGHTDIVKLLLDNKADVNSRARGWTALQAAAEGGHIDTVKLLLDRKADVNAQAGVYGLTALQAAARGGHIDVVKLLLDNKADVDAQAGVYGLTALQAAARGGHIDIVKLLLATRPTKTYADGWEALQAATSCGHIDVANLLQKSLANQRRPRWL